MPVAVGSTTPTAPASSATPMKRDSHRGTSAIQGAALAEAHQIIAIDLLDNKAASQNKLNNPIL